MAGPPQERPLSAEVSRALLTLHKEQFGRGPSSARSHFSGDLMATVFQDALLPSEIELAEMGEVMRVQESRLFFQEATRGRFIEVIEQIVGRKVVSFHSTCDPRARVVIEVALFERDSPQPEPESTLGPEGL